MAGNQEKKVLILYTSVGLGHKTIAENIAYHLEKAGFQVNLYDVLQLQTGWLVNFGTWLHQLINTKTPFIWKWLYNSRLVTDLTLSSRIKVAAKNYQHVKAIIDDFQPDLIITTQTTASAVIAFLKQKGWYKNLFAIAFSDYHLHQHWLYDQADFYLVNIEEQKREMVALGISTEKIYVIGMTLKPKSEINVEAVKQKLRVPMEQKVLLLASGSLGTGIPIDWLENLIKQLEESQEKTHLIIACGKNQELYEKLKKKVQSPQVTVLPFYSPANELYAISDLYLTKPGGLTVAETLQQGLPLLITHWLPGQEEINYHYLIGRRLVMPKSRDLMPVIKEELSTNSFRESLISNPERLKLVQLGQEGQALITAVEKEFHTFDRSESSQ